MVGYEFSMNRCLPTCICVAVCLSVCFSKNCLLCLVFLLSLTVTDCLLCVSLSLTSALWLERSNGDTKNRTSIKVDTFYNCISNY